MVPQGPLSAGWGVPIATDTAFAVALIVLLGDRVPVELRVFLTAAVIIDDLVAIAVIALFYSDAINAQYLIASVAVTGLLMALNHWGIYRSLPYAVLGVLLWICLYGAGLHATLAGVVLAVVTPTRPAANLRALLAQAQAVIRAEARRAGEAVMRHGPSEPALQALDAIHDRIESPADKLLRSMEPWSIYFVLPVFALANAGVILSLGVFETHGRLMLAIILGAASPSSRKHILGASFVELARSPASMADAVTAGVRVFLYNKAYLHAKAIREQYLKHPGPLVRWLASPTVHAVPSMATGWKESDT